MSEVGAAVYELRRLLAAFLGRPQPPPELLRPLLGGAVLAAVLVGAEVVRRRW